MRLIRIYVIIIIHKLSNYIMIEANLRFLQK